MPSHTCPYISLLNLLNPINLFLMCCSNSHFPVTVQALLCFMAKCQNFSIYSTPNITFVLIHIPQEDPLKDILQGVVACTHNRSFLAEHETERW